MGYRRPAAGRIEFQGQRLDGLRTHEIARLGLAFAPEDGGVFGDLTVAENIEIGTWTRPSPRPAAERIERAYAVFPRLRGYASRGGMRLSGGERKMLSIARALALDPALLLLDEPFEGLAPTIVQELFAVFDRLRSRTSIVIVEHNLDLVLALADRVFALERGAVFHAGPAGPLLTDLDYRKRILWL
jgi:ABC-type branched-subunit amino acid transport system ATPase component